MYTCEVNTINAVLQYLSTKPFTEVEGLINALKAGTVEKVDEKEAPEIITEA